MPMPQQALVAIQSVIPISSVSLLIFPLAIDHRSRRRNQAQSESTEIDCMTCDIPAVVSAIVSPPPNSTHTWERLSRCK